MKRNIKISREKYFRAILLLINQMGLNMTDLELTIIVTSLNNNMIIFNRYTRGVLKKMLNLDRYTFNNYVKRLKDKGVLVQYDGDLGINKGLIASIQDREIHIIFEIDDSKDHDKD